jgi:hypothetical protein
VALGGQGSPRRPQAATETQAFAQSASLRSPSTHDPESAVEVSGGDHRQRQQRPPDGESAPQQVVGPVEHQQSDRVGFLQLAKGTNVAASTVDGDTAELCDVDDRRHRRPGLLDELRHPAVLFEQRFDVLRAQESPRHAMRDVPVDDLPPEGETVQIDLPLGQPDRAVKSRPRSEIVTLSSRRVIAFRCGPAQQHPGPVHRLLEAVDDDGPVPEHVQPSRNLDAQPEHRRGPAEHHTHQVWTVLHELGEGPAGLLGGALQLRVVADVHVGVAVPDPLPHRLVDQRQGAPDRRSGRVPTR